MMRIEKIAKSKFLGITIILLQQLIAFLILVYNRENLSLLFSEKVALVMTLIDTGFIWLAAILRQNKMGFLKIISIVFLTIWQYLVSVLSRETPLFLVVVCKLYCFIVIPLRLLI